MNSEDSLDEEFLDDPITLIDVTDTSHKDNKGGYRSSRTSFVPVTFFDITNNVRLLNDCRPLFIKVVDCDKHPWYYKKFYKKHNTGQRDIHEYNKCIFYKNGIDDHLSKDNFIHTVTIDESESDTMDSDVQDSVPKTWLLPKTKKIKYSFKRITSTKSILTIKRNNNSKKRKKKKSDVDFKRNKGLIGLKITKTTNIIDLDSESHVDSNEIESYNNEHEKVASSEQLDLVNIDDDKSLNQVDTIMCPISQSQAASLHDKDNKIIEKTHSLSSSENMKSLSPIFPCKPPSNKSVKTSIKDTPSISSLEPSKISTDNSYELSIADILEDPRVIEAVEKVASQNIIIHPESFRDTEKQKVSLDSINRNDQNTEIAGLSKSASQISVAQSTPQESSSPILTKQQSDNKQYVAGHQSKSVNNTAITNARKHQHMPSYNYYPKYNTLQNNLMNKTTLPMMCPVHKTSIEGNCSLTQSSKPSLIFNQKHSESNLNYFNYMNVVVGMGRNHGPGETSSISQTPYPTEMQAHYNNISPAFRQRHQADYFRMGSNFSYPAQYANFNYQNFSRPYLYQTNPPRYPPLLRPPPPPPLPPSVIPAPQIPIPNVHQTIPPQFQGEKPPKSVEKRTNNSRKSHTVATRKLHAVTDSAKMYNNVHSPLHGKSSKAVKCLNEQIKLKKSNLSLNKTVNIAESKTEMLRELEKEMMNIHGEIYNTKDVSRTPPDKLKKAEESKNESKHDDTTQNWYNVRQNNVFDIPFKLQETVINNRPAQSVNSTIKDDRNFSVGSTPRNDLKRISLNKPSNFQNTSVPSLSKKSRVAHNPVLRKNDTHTITQRNINISKPSKDYSPPILPIPSYDKTLQILTRATFEAQKYLDKQRNIDMEKQKVKTTEHFENNNDKQDKGKKISLEEYKNRQLNESIMKNVNQKLTVENNMSNARTKNLGDVGRISDLDQGYASDTVTI